MTPNNKKPPAAKGMPTQSKQATARPHQFNPVVAQLKAGSPAHCVKRPIALLLKKPQPRLQVAQAKPAVAPAKTRVFAQVAKSPVAPPVYRPQAKPHAVQTKMVAPSRMKDRPVSAGPKDRPQPGQQVLQTKRTVNRQATKTGPVQKPPQNAGTSRVHKNASAGGQHCVQMRKPEGFYKVNTTANLRAENHNHTVKRQIAEGQTVYAQNNTLLSNFKAGTHWYSTTNEHTWVEWDDPSDPENESLEAQGWIEDSKLDPAPPILQQVFRPGDKIYGRHETRRGILRSRKLRNRAVRDTRFNIIDDVNDRIAEGVTDQSDKEVRDFAGFAAARTGVAASEIELRKRCKLGLAFTTTRANVIHFMLDGLNADHVVIEAVHTRNNQEAYALGRRMPHNTKKNCTGAEMRALMRQRLHDTGSPGGKDSGIDLTRVKFYMSYAEIPPPWARDAPPEWSRAWTDYSSYRAQVGAQKGRIEEARSKDKGKGKGRASSDDESD